METSAHLATLRYVKVERTMKDGLQVIHEHQRQLQLFTDRICSKHHLFALGDVHDMSYRRIGAGEGLLYLHTVKGVFPYTVREDPQAFLEAYRQHRDK